MINELNELAVGVDLGKEFSQITFYSRKNSEPMTVSQTAGEEDYQIPTPREVFAAVEGERENGPRLLADFLEQCLKLLAGAGKPDSLFLMVTMKKVRRVWADAVWKAAALLQIPARNVYLQDHRESFAYYMLNQRKDLWNYQAALFEYEKDRITAYEMDVDGRTKPAFVTVKEFSHIYVDEKARNGRSEEQWKEEKDRLFYNQAEEMFRGRVFSSVYLIGEGFDREWAKNSLAFLCMKRHVFMGQNLYTKGACYSAMQRCGMLKKGDYLYHGPDMMEYNIGMNMLIRGNDEYYPMSSAGLNWYAAKSECEFVLDDTDCVEICSVHMNGTKKTHTIALTDLPERPNRATRIHMKIEFASKDRCRVILEDLGLGNLYPSSGKRWEAVIPL